MILARWIRTAESRAIVEGIYGSVPPGLFGAFRRIADGAALPAGSYRQLFAVLSDPQQRPRARLLRHVGEFSGVTLAIIAALEPALLRPEIVTRVDSVRMATRLNRALALIREACSTATDQAVEESIRRLQKDATLESWLQRWARRSDRLAGPVGEEDRDLRPLGSAAMLLARAREYRNCLGFGHVLSEAMLGLTAYVEWRHQPAIARLQTLGRHRWLLTGMYAPENEPPSAAVMEAMSARLVEVGVVVPGANHDLRSLAELFGVYTHNLYLHQAGEEDEMVAA